MIAGRDVVLFLTKKSLKPKDNDNMGMLSSFLNEIEILENSTQLFKDNQPQRNAYSEFRVSNFVLSTSQTKRKSHSFLKVNFETL